MVKIIPGFRATFPGNQFGATVTRGIPSNYVKIPRAREYSGCRANECGDVRDFAGVRDTESGAIFRLMAASRISIF